MRCRTAELEGVQGEEGVAPNSLADVLIGFQRLELDLVKAIPTKSDRGLDLFASSIVAQFPFLLRQCSGQEPSCRVSWISCGSLL
jgi:hypothetical protein